MIRSQKELSEAKHPTQGLSQTDKLVLRYSQARDWTQGNQKTLAIIGVIVLLAAAGLFYYGSVSKSNNERALTLVARIEPAYVAGDYRHAIDGDPTHRIQGEPVVGLRQIVSDYGSTDAGSVAELYLGNAYYYLGKYDSAQTMFEKASFSVPVAQASLDAGKAAIYEHKGNNEEAAKLFQSAVHRDEHNPLNADYTLSAARDLQQAGKKDEAVKLYKDLLEKYPGTQFDDAAKRALMEMNIPT